MADDLFDKVRAARGRPCTPEISSLADELALASAHRIIDSLSGKFKLRLTRSEWSQMTALIQSEISALVRYTVFDRPVWPGDDLAQ